MNNLKENFRKKNKKVKKSIKLNVLKILLNIKFFKNKKAKKKKQTSFNCLNN